ncbi:MAG: hypothetical protein QOD65_3757 [Gaiellales bacterium]|nr:hypothetical protein [Gaiellales bacterium]
MIRVLVAEDEEPLCAAICDLVRSEPGLEIVGAAATAADAIELAAATTPDVALVDVRMPGGGPATVRGIRQHSPTTAILALSAYEDQATVLEMLRAGAVGYLVKGISPVEVIEAIHRASRGQASLSVDVIASVINELSNDMAERQEAVEVLRGSEERFRSLLESAPDAVVIIDSQGTIVLVNRQTEQLFGYPRDELLGIPVETLLPARFRERHVPHRTGYFADPRTRPMGAGLALAGKRRDGTEFPVDISLSAIETEDGRLATAFIRNITERKEAEDVRRKSEERFAAVLESAPDAVAIIDERGRIVLVNEQTESLFGYGRQELLGEPVEILLPERFRNGHVAHRGGYFADPRTRPMGVDLELAGRRKDGSEFPVDVSLAAIETEEGWLATAFIRDTTERRRGEVAVRHLAAIVESSDDAIIGKTLEGTILTWNRGAERMYGYAPEEVIGRALSILVPPDYPDEHPEILERLQRNEEIEQLDTQRMRKDGTLLDVSLKISAIRDGDGRIIGASSIARDITQLKAQAALERAHAERQALLGHLVAAGEEERARIAGDIHDDSIQAMTAAGMRLQILRRKLEDGEQVKLLDELEETIQLSIARLRHLLFELRPPVLDNEGLSAALRLYMEEADDTSTHYRLEDKLRSQPVAETRVILYRIVQEALTNVRKHAGAATVTVALHEREGGYLARVTDDGAGFLPDDANPMPGHLGLAAMRERATLAGGWLRIDTLPGRGTTVEIWLPAGLAQNGSPLLIDNDGSTPVEAA